MYDYEFYSTETSVTTQKLLIRANALCSLKTPNALGGILGLESKIVFHNSSYPQYHSFTIPKKDGSKRLIESPVSNLKDIQSRLNRFLQGAYYTVMTNAAYGFIPVPTDETYPRNIYTNAMLHIGNKWVLNIDLKDFFHFIKEDRIRKVFMDSPFMFSSDMAQFMARLTCHNGRLPMGAPTSPVLSNFACLKLDAMLMTLAEARGWNFSRFADDMTFSSNNKFSQKDIDAILRLINKEGFEINTDKLCLKHIDDKPEVTGLVLRKMRPDISDSFLRLLKEDIRMLKIFVQTSKESWHELLPADAVKRLKACIQGKLAFLKKVRGESDQSYYKLLRKASFSFE